MQFIPDWVKLGIPFQCRQRRPMPYTTLISAQDLHPLLSAADCVVIDCRHDLAQPDAGRNAYLQAHIPGAHFLHLDEDLSGLKTGTNGRHPLPEVDTLNRTLARCGIGHHTQVVAYDDSGGIFAARLWWLLRWLGHREVAVLDGGLSAWRQARLPLTREQPVPCTGALEWLPVLPTTTTQQLLASLESCEQVIIDARAADRFQGQNETLDPVGGHIPGAINRFFKLNLNEDGTFKSASALEQEFNALLQDYAGRQVIHQCGSGVTACHNLLAMEIAGRSGSILYPGSWSEWCSDLSRPMAGGLE